METKQLLTLLLLGLSIAEGERVLIMQSIFGGSHVMLGRSLGAALVSKGHKVDILRWKNVFDVPQAGNNNSVLETVLSVNNEVHPNKWFTPGKEAAFHWSSKSMGEIGGSFLRTTLEMLGLGLDVIEKQCDALLSNTELHWKLQNSEYDVIVVDLSTNLCSGVLASHYKIPTIGFWTSAQPFLELNIADAYFPASTVPQFGSGFTENMSFVQRVENWVRKAVSIGTMWFFVCPTVQGVFDKHGLDIGDPCLEVERLRGMLLLRDPALHPEVLAPQTFVNVGGLQLRKDESSSVKIDPELNNWIRDSEKHGIIVFSMGSVLRLQNFLDEDSIANIFSAFGRLKQRVVMHFGNGVNSTQNHTVPKNVRMEKWIPQQALLGMDSTVLFVSHCGLNGVTESVYYGVPIVCIPIFWDHYDSAALISNKGLGVQLQRQRLTEESVYSAITEVLGNRKYKDKTMLASNRMRTAAKSPTDRAIDLIKNTVRQRHNRIVPEPRIDIPFYQKYYLEFFGSLFLFLFSASFLLSKTVYKLLSSSLKVLGSTSYRVFNLNKLK